MTKDTPPPHSRATPGVPTTSAGPPPPPPRYTLVLAMRPPHAQPAPAAMATPPPSRSAAHALHALVRHQFPHLPATSAPVPGYAFLGAAGPAPITPAATAAHPPALATVAFPVAADATHHHHHHHLFPTLLFAPPPGPPSMARATSVPAPNTHGAVVGRGAPRAAAAAASGGSRAGSSVVGGGSGAPLTPSPAFRAVHPSTPTGAASEAPSPSLADLARVEAQLDLTSTGCKGRAVTADMQDTFVRTLAAVHTIVKDKLYRARTPTMEQYFTQYHKISRAQVYRLLDCHAIMQDLRDFDRKPLKQRICRTLKKVTPAREPRRRLWQAVIDKWGHDPAAMANLTSADIITTWTKLVESDAALRAATGGGRDAASVDESDADGLDASDPAWADGASPSSVPPATPTPIPPPPVPPGMAAWSAAATANVPWPDDAMWAGMAAVDPATHVVKTEPAAPPHPTLPPPLVPHAHLADWWSARADHLAPGEFMPSRHRSPVPPAPTSTPGASTAPAPAGATADRGHPVVVFSVRASSAAPAPPATPTPARVVDAPRHTPDPTSAAAAATTAAPTDLTGPLRVVDPPPAAATPPPSTRGARGKARGKARGGTRGSATKPRGGRGRGKGAVAVAAARGAVPVPPPPPRKVEDEDADVASPAAKRRRRSRAEILLDEAAAAFAGPSSNTGSAARSRARRIPSAAAAAAETGKAKAESEKVKVKVDDGQEEGEPQVKTEPELAPTGSATHVAGAPTPVSVPIADSAAPSLPPPPPPPAPAPNVVLQLSPALRPLLPSASGTRPTLLEPTRVDDAWADFDADCLARLAASPVYASRRPPIGHVRYRTASAGGYQPGATGTGAFALPPASALGFMPPPAAGPPPAAATTASYSPWPSPRYRMPSFGLGLALPLPPPPPPPPAVSAARSRTASGIPTDLAAAAAAADWPTRPGTPGGGNGAWILASPRIDPARVGIQAPAAREEMQAWMDGGIAPYYLHAPMPAEGAAWSGYGAAGPWWMSEHEHGKGPAPAELAMEMGGGRRAPDERRPFGAQ